MNNLKKSSIINVLRAKGDISVEDVIKKIYYKWIISIDPKYKIFEDYIDIDLKKDFEDYKYQFKNEPSFLFFVGYILDVEPWILIENYVADMEGNDLLGQKFISKAHSLDSKEFYEWALEKDRDKRNQLAKKLHVSQEFPMNDEIIGEYFRRIFNANTPDFGSL